MFDYKKLMKSVKSVMSEEYWENYDVNSFVKEAEYCWNDTGIRVECDRFNLIFDAVTYDYLAVE